MHDFYFIPGSPNPIFEALIDIYVVEKPILDSGQVNTPSHPVCRLDHISKLHLVRSGESSFAQNYPFCEKQSPFGEKW